MSATAPFSFPSRRSTVHSVRGIVSSSQPLASSAGIAILEQGGNAADAAVAVAAALNVTEPVSTGIGGDAFCLYWDAKLQRVRGINGSGRSGSGVTLEKLTSKGQAQAQARHAGSLDCDGPHELGSQLPFDSVHAVTVPGAAAAWCDTVRLLGSGKVTLRQVLAPAIRLAEDGVPICAQTAHDWARGEALLKKASANAKEMLHAVSGAAPKEGEIMRYPGLAQTFRLLAEKGKDGFYKGRVAEEIVKVVSARGGHLTLEDVAHHGEQGSEEVQPISYNYKSGAACAGSSSSSSSSEAAVRLYECPPNGQGLVALQALCILDELQASGKIQALLSMQHNSADYLHALVAALRLAFADATAFVADPAHDVQGAERVEKMLSNEYAKQRAALFESDSIQSFKNGNPTSSTDTVYFSVVDQQGNACSFINSNYAGFGSAIIPAGCGFTLQNRGAGFVLEEGHLNCVAPRKRPYHTIIPAMATHLVPDGKGGHKEDVLLCYGVMGGYMQPQGHVQVLLNILRGMSPQASLDAPRFVIGAGTPDQGDIFSQVFLEQGIPQEVAAELKRRGHDVKIVEGWESRKQFGKGQVIRRLDFGDGAKGWAAGSDPRGDGAAIPQT
ncbi:gamma-glutamyltranspeptidase [Ceraceosorus guamensis]|uniref:Gamma-glutamyltranspeptidase n=1 Tax=Ceraceosorus guamensis TaxID=1522189 RepID=A0A316W528_9BASI|nr:gamma-glutamyltranspeptidase [Ceraceosorus guamensis]PWN45026.1 gamma-glutamyltranspeptidase [Ceraceosorus guamensis]